MEGIVTLRCLKLMCGSTYEARVQVCARFSSLGLLLYHGPAYRGTAPGNGP